MKVLILLLLAVAVLRSLPQLGMMPRGVRWGIWLVVAVLPVLLFHPEAAQYNLEVLDRVLARKSNLESLCTVVVVQELLVTLAGFGFAARLELGEKPLPRHCLALMPSCLIPVGALYILAACFNHWVEKDFTLITWSVAGGLMLAGVFLGELPRLLWRTAEARLRAVLNGGLLLLVPAIFLPAAAVAEYSRREEPPSVAPWPALALLAGVALLSFVVIHLVKIIRKAA